MTHNPRRSRRVQDTASARPTATPKQRATAAQIAADRRVARVRRAANRYNDPAVRAWATRYGIDLSELEPFRRETNASISTKRDAAS